MQNRDIRLHIDELILEGIEWRDSQRFEVALQQRLQQLFTQHGIPPGLNQQQVIPSVDGGNWGKTGQAGMDSLGIHVANTIYNGMTRG